MTEPRTDQRVCLVTGGGTGIGAATARLLADRGDRVVVTGRRSEPLAAVSGPRIAAVPADVSDPDQVHALIERIQDEHGRLDGLVANAGIMAVGSVADTDLAVWREVLDVNVTSTYLLARAAMPLLRARQGAVVVVGSIAALRNGAQAAAYSVSKAAVAMLARSIAIDEARHGVRANVVHPGWVRTEMADAEMAAFGAEVGVGVEEAYAEVTRLVPQQRAADAREVAAAVAWLLGPEASYVTGAELVVDGGTTLVDAGTVPFGFSVSPR